MTWFCLHSTSYHSAKSNTLTPSKPVTSKHHKCMQCLILDLAKLPTPPMFIHESKSRNVLSRRRQALATLWNTPSRGCRGNETRKKDFPGSK